MYQVFLKVLRDWIASNGPSPSIRIAKSPIETLFKMGNYVGSMIIVMISYMLTCWKKKRFKRKASACRLLNGDWRKSALWDGWGCFWGIRVSQDRNQTSTQKHHLYMGPKMKTQLTPTYEKGTIWNHVTFHCTGNRDPCATCTNWVV